MVYEFEPWGWTYDGSSDYSIGPEADPQGDDRVASVWDKNDERARAKVSLIAAAPELLKMLKRHEYVHQEDWGIDWCPECGGVKPGSGTDMQEGHKPDCELAALIAKAEGK